MSDPLGYQLLLLHAHLPFVRHPEFEEVLEEDWLYEAISETYLPVLKMLEGFERDGVRACFAMTLTPPLCEMLADPLLQERYLRHLRKLMDLANREVHRTRTESAYHQAALMYAEEVAAGINAAVSKRCFSLLKRIGMRPLAGFRQVGIDVYHDDQRPEIRPVVEDLIAGRLPQIRNDQVCGGGGGH